MLQKDKSEINTLLERHSQSIRNQYIHVNSNKSIQTKQHVESQQALRKNSQNKKPCNSHKSEFKMMRRQHISNIWKPMATQMSLTLSQMFRAHTRKRMTKHHNHTIATEHTAR